MALRVAAVPLTGSLSSGSGSVFAGANWRRVSFKCAPPMVVVRSQTNRHAGLQGVPETEEKGITGVVFEPFQEVQRHVTKLPGNLNESLARQRFNVSCESAINEQINVEYNVSYVYHALFCYFDRDNVALPGLAKFFQESSVEEREHAEKLMKYQNKRGGKVMLQSIVLPQMDFGNQEKGEALYAMELTLALEKLTTEKLYNLHKVAEDAHDVQLTDYVESEFLEEQIESIKKISEYVAQLRRIGNDGHGVYYWDRVLLETPAA